MLSKATLLKHKEKVPTVADLANKTRILSEAKRFRIIKLLSKTKVSSADCTRPIVLLEFDFDAKSLFNSAGHYILLHNVDNETITRAYTPICPDFVFINNGKLFENEKNSIKNKMGTLEKISSEKAKAVKTNDEPENRLFFLIRLYKKGRMSNIISRLSINNSLRLTGPFERQQLLAPVDFGFGSNCWRRIILLAGGTGITPMINVLFHHLKYGINKCKILLIWYNKTTSDIPCIKHFEYIKQKYINRLYIDLIFSNYNQNSNQSIERELLKFGRIFEYKWNKKETLEMIKVFLKNGKPIHFENQNYNDKINNLSGSDINEEKDLEMEMV
eukprot:332270_1